MKTTCYVQVVPEFIGRGGNTLYKLSVARVTVKKPTRPMGGAVTVKLTLDIADAAFMPLAPEATIVIPAEHTEAVLAVTTEPMEVPE